MLKRRQVVSGLCTLALPGVATAQSRNVLRLVPRYGLATLDPVFTTDSVTRMCGLAVFESLYSVDENLVPKPQMAEGHVIEQDGRRWTIRLREGLRFHDGEPVLAKDCVASITRWMKRDLLSRSFAPRLDALEAPDDRTVVIRLKQPFSHLPFALGKPLPNILPIMPAYLAAADVGQPITTLVGSGPFRFIPGEFSAGNFAAFAKFERYEARDEPANGTAGGRHVLIDRVEWKAIPDPATAANALITGEVDWLETPLPDLVPRLRATRDVTVGQLDPYGYYSMLRLNHLQGPTADRAIRQAIMAAIDPVEIMQAFVGDDESQYTAPVGVFVPNVPSASSAGMERLGGKKSNAEVRALLRAAGYGGERLVALHAVDNAFSNTVMQVVVARLRAVGMNLDDVAIDQGTLVQRRNSREPLDNGGWSIMPVNPSGADHLDPLVALGLRTGAAAWVGWPESKRMEELRTAWIDSNDEGERRSLTIAIQEEALVEVVYIPLGRYFLPSAWRRGLSGILNTTVPVFWNVRKA